MPGYIYVLINTSMPGLVKIGRTARDPEGRVKELSGATGVPTPFILIYKAYFEEHEKAERMIHQFLAKKRLSGNREFFQLDPDEAINTVISFTNSEVAPSLQAEIDAKQTSNKDEAASTLFEQGDHLIEQGDQFYDGAPGVFQNFEKAYDCYQKATQLNHPFAYRKLGKMEENGKGRIGNIQKTIEYYKKAVDLNFGLCYGDLGLIFMGNKHHNPEKAEEYWGLFFRYIEILNDKNLTDLNDEIANILIDYLYYTDLLDGSFKQIELSYHKHIIEMYLSEISTQIEKRTDLLTEYDRDKRARYKRICDYFNIFLDIFR